MCYVLVLLFLGFTGTGAKYIGCLTCVFLSQCYVSDHSCMEILLRCTFFFFFNMFWYVMKLFDQICHHVFMMGRNFINIFLFHFFCSLGRNASFRYAYICIHIYTCVRVCVYIYAKNIYICTCPHFALDREELMDERNDLMRHLSVMQYEALHIFVRFSFVFLHTSEPLLCNTVRKTSDS